MKIWLAVATVLLAATAAAGVIATPAVAADNTGPLINIGSGRCMTASGSTVTMTSSCPDRPSHLWTLVYDAPTNTRALRHEGTGSCLSEVSPGLVRLDTCHRDDLRQNWHPRLSPYSVTFRADDSSRYLAEQSGAVRTTTVGSGTT